MIDPVSVAEQLSHTYVDADRPPLDIQHIQRPLDIYNYAIAPEEVSVELIEDDKRFELYDILGNYIGCFTELPKDIRSGIYISRGANGSKKIVLR